MQPAGRRRPISGMPLLVETERDDRVWFYRDKKAMIWQKHYQLIIELVVLFLITIINVSEILFWT